jgi:two-component system sporulation sensor kinase B
VTHEIGNFLNNLGLSFALLKSEKLSSKGERALALVDKESIRIRGFTENFLKFAKVPELHLERTSLENIIRETIILQQPEADKRGVHFEFNWPTNMPSVNVDHQLIYQIFSNLIKNSLEAMIDTGIIRIDGMISRNYLQIILSDTGSGIESEVMEKIFDPFFTTKGKQGTGLGLSIVKTIMEAHRGTINCESQINKGTTFILNFPLQ